MKYPPLPELTAAHPEWRKAETLPADFLGISEISVYTQRSPYTVLEACRTGQLRAAQTSKGGTWKALLPDVQRWALNLPQARPGLRRLESA